MVTCWPHFRALLTADTLMVAQQVMVEIEMCRHQKYLHALPPVPVTLSLQTQCPLPYTLQTTGLCKVRSELLLCWLTREELVQNLSVCCKFRSWMRVFDISCGFLILNRANFCLAGRKVKKWSDWFSGSPIVW